jgi:head-tail adaptor
MKAGRLRHWLQLERPVRTGDRFSGVVVTWAPVATVPAAIDALTGGAGGREFLGADRELAGLTWKITIRAIPGTTVEPDWRGVSVGDDTARVFDFVALLPSHVRDELSIAATSGQSQP